MKIGILTFHWGTNYGGVLQAYALQCFLVSLGYNVEIINYAPKTFRDSFLLCFKNKSLKTIKENIFNYFKEKKFKRFRNANLILSDERYYNKSSYKDFENKYDFIIVGSDQVWNPYIALGYGAPYWLPMKSSTYKIAYAVSLGCDDYPKEILKKLIGFINDFNAISVREKSAVDIIQSVYKKGMVELMPDPTLIVDSGIFKKFIHVNPCDHSCFFYVLQQKQKLITDLERKLQNSFIINKPSDKKYGYSIEEWISAIYNNKYIVTNSFHGVMFSLIFHKDFFVIPVEGKLAGMNDRIYTILGYLNLEDRIIKDVPSFYDKNKEIDWLDVDNKINKLKEAGKTFLLKSIRV